MTSLVCQMVVGKAQTMNACGVCLVEGHLTNMCPTIKKSPLSKWTWQLVFLDKHKGSIILIQECTTRDEGITPIIVTKSTSKSARNLISFKLPAI
jgi:hypothetical protein